LVDLDDFENISKHRWYLHSAGYACSNIKNKPVYMHRVILSPKAGICVDHINGKRLDNRKNNLRACTRGQNLFNTHFVCGTSKYFGVYKHRNKWAASISHKNKHIHVGVFKTEKQAALARDRVAKKLRGVFAKLNFRHPL